MSWGHTSTMCLTSMIQMGIIFWRGMRSSWCWRRLQGVGREILQDRSWNFTLTGLWWKPMLIEMEKLARTSSSTTTKEFDLPSLLSLWILHYWPNSAFEFRNTIIFVEIFGKKPSSLWKKFSPWLKSNILERSCEVCWFWENNPSNRRRKVK